MVECVDMIISVCGKLAVVKGANHKSSDFVISERLPKVRHLHTGGLL